ncbi:MAG: glycosyltransferase [Melioribacter sp.]|nr:glycosyltransferase [Melioribacter sp.]
MKIFFLTPRVPYPIDKGDKLRAYYQIKFLSKRHEIYLFSLDENSCYKAEKDPLRDICKKVKVVKLSKLKIFLNLLVGLFRDIPLQTAYYYSSDIKKEIKKEIEQFKPDLIYCQLIRSAEYVRNIQSIPKIIDYVDVISKGLERRIRRTNIFWKLILTIEHKRALKYEKIVFDDFDERIIITTEDQDQLKFEEKGKVKIIPNGIDSDYYKPIPFERKYDLFFSGNLRYPPNVDASIFIVEEILPLLKLKVPNIKVLIAGAAPNSKILSLQSKTVVIKGWVEDIREYYKQAKIFLAPMQIGTGLQNKLLQAMTMKIPCVTSELTKKGIVSSGENIMLVANTPQEYVDQILKLLSDQKYADEIAELGFKYAKTHFDWEQITQKLEQIFISTIKKNN